MKPECFNPPELGKAIGYSNGVLAPAGARMLHVAGQIAWDTDHNLVGGGDFVKQFEQTLRNVMSVVTAAGGAADDLVELMIFVTDKQQYMGNLREIGAAYRRVCGKHFPAMALVEVKGLLEPGALVEIRGVAAISGR
jgi:enamine deaminase RidA (YjgF/YER057c/UK114 family)